MKYILTAFLFSFFIANDNKTRETLDKDFAAFLNAIPSRSVPLELRCGLPDGTILSQNVKKFERFIPKSTDKVLGSLKTNRDSFKLILFGLAGEYHDRVLFSFTNNGQPIDSLYLILDGCRGADETESTQSSVTIDKDLRIIVTDTGTSVEFSDDGSDNDQAAETLYMSRFEATIDENGRFKRD